MSIASFLIPGEPFFSRCVAQETRTQNRPHIIFILADDLGWTDIQVGDDGPNVLNGVNYGSKYYQTPNLAKLASRGISFTHCYAHPNCAPTRAAILSGQYAPRSGNGVYHVTSLNRQAKRAGETKLIPPKQRQDVPADHLIYPELLQQAGYRTCHIGKYHVGGKEGGRQTLPLNQGFNFNYGGTDKGGPKDYHAKNLKFSDAISESLDAFARNYTTDYVQENLIPFAHNNNTNDLVDSAKHVEDAVGDAAIHFIENHLAKSDGKPFYLQMHHYAVHSPIRNEHSRRDLLSKYKALTPSEHHKNPAYGAILENLDQTVGRVMRCLEDPNQDGDKNDSVLDETIIFFTSDNGGIGKTDNHPLRHVKGSFYEGGIRVPLIVVNPRVENTERTKSNTLVHSVDFYPTILEAAGVSRPDDQILDGESFWKTASEQTVRNRQPIFYHFPGYLDARARPCSVIIERIEGKQYKLIYNYDNEYTGNPQGKKYRNEGLKKLSSPYELYCISDDLSETKNLLGPEREATHEALANSMIGKLHVWLTQDDETWDAKPLIDRSTGNATALPQPIDP